MPIPDPPGRDDWASTPFPAYTPEETARIVAASPTVDVAADLGITLASQPDGTYRGACPWCRGARSFAVAADGSWTCYACTEGGRDALVLVATKLGLWRLDAVAWLDWRLSGGRNRVEGEGP